MIVLFDVDGTLILTGGAGTRAYGRAFEAQFGLVGAFKEFASAGMIDPDILESGLRHHNLDPGPTGREEFFSRYLGLLDEELLKPGGQRMPGVPDVVEAVRNKGWVPAILTGNIEQGAKRKLNKFDLWDRFDFGAFGNDGTDRNSLVPVARQRANDRGLTGPMIIVGDTPRDVECAHANDVKCIGVAAGKIYSEDQLSDAGADIVLPDLTDFDRFLEALESLL